MPYSFPVQGIGTLITATITQFLGCTDTTAFNYNPLATQNDGSCVPFIYGCTVQYNNNVPPNLALNYNPNANTDDGSCFYGQSGCTTQFAGLSTPQQLTAQNYDATAVIDDGSCLYLGCIDSSQANYNPYANANDPNNPCIASLVHIPDLHFRYVLVHGTTTSVNYQGVIQVIPFWTANNGTNTPISGFGINNSSWRNSYGIVTPNGEYIDKTLVTGITHLDLTSIPGLPLALNLTGINHFTLLQFLRCSSQSLTQLNLSQNTALTHLRCEDQQGGNKITALSLPPGNTNLTYLNCGKNMITTLDLTSKVALTTLYCGSNQLGNLDVSQNTALTTLECWGNQLTGLDVSQNTALTFLDCNSNQLTGLNTNTNNALKNLNCRHQGTPFTSLNLINNTALEILDCSQNSIFSLTNISNLKQLYCQSNKLTNLNVASNGTKLIRLNCSSNLLTDLDVSQNTELKILLCADNYLTSLDLTNTKIGEGSNSPQGRLDCSNNSFGWAHGTNASNANTGLYVPNINNILNIANSLNLGNGTLFNANVFPNPNFNASRLWPLTNHPMDIKVNVVAGTTPYSSVDNSTSFIT
jgi:hypothetical protein